MLDIKTPEGRATSPLVVLPVPSVTSQSKFSRARTGKGQAYNCKW